MCFSLQAVESMFHMLYGLYPNTGAMKAYEAQSFASMARQYNLILPKVACIVHNK